MLCHHSLKMGIVMIIILLSGCQMAGGNKEGNSVKPSEISGEELPDVRAFQDEFTRGFMKSPEEVEDGFYVFQSGTGLYEMWLPGGAVIDERGYSLQSNETFEVFLAGIENQNGSESSIQLTFNNYDEQKDTEMNLNRLRIIVEEDLTFNKIDLNNKEVYISPLEIKTKTDEGYGATFGHTVFIQNSKGTGSIEMHYTILCVEGSSVSCEEIRNVEYEKVKRLASSITFKEGNGS